MRLILSTFLLLLTLAVSQAAPINLAPEFSVLGAGNQRRSLKSLRGQSVVLIISDSAKRRSFRKQLRNLEEIYQQFASKQVIFVAAVPETDATIPSNIPVAIAVDGSAVAAAYGMEKGFRIAIIGRDGNLDYQTGKVLPPERVRDVIQNSFAVQVSARKGN
ncbi:MAG TPA: hypothetical protein VF593_13420 [Chthoniobacteraceae bacterium]|jgi:hypothetical protein